VPTASLLSHLTAIHGQSHVSRVMVDAFRLNAAAGWIEEGATVVGTFATICAP